MSGISSSQPTANEVKQPMVLPSNDVAREKDRADVKAKNQGEVNAKGPSEVKGEKVSPGHDKKNTMSHTDGVDPLAEMGPASDSSKPVLVKLPQTEPVSKEHLKANAEQIHHKMDAIHLEKAVLQTADNPEVHKLSSYMSSTELSAEMKATVHEHVEMIKQVLKEAQADPTKSHLTKGKLEEILQNLTAKLGETQSKRAEADIKAQAEEKQKIHKQILEKIEERNQCEKNINSNGIKCGGHKFFALRVVESYNRNEIDRLNREITQLKGKRDNLPNVAKAVAFSGKFNIPDDLNDETIKDIELQLTSRNLDKQAYSPTEKTMEHLSTEDSLLEGLAISRDSMTQAEFMRLLQRLQAANDNNEKLEEAIVALQSGDPKAAAEILNGITDDITGLSDDDSQSLNTMIESTLNTATLTAKETMQRVHSEAIENLEQVELAAEEQQKLAEETDVKKNPV